MHKPLAKSHSRKRKIFLSLGLILLLAFLTLMILEKTHTTDLIKMPGNTKITAKDKPAQTTSKEPSAQSTFSNGQPRSTTTTNKTEGIVTDKHGTIPSTPDESLWSKSANGSLVVYSPTQNTTLTSGQSISGSSTSNRVSFRLMDNITGVISQGSISVVNGKFSGTFNFSSKATEGRVDFFTATPDGVESNNVSIPVRL